jgi:hypothetical protein
MFEPDIQANAETLTKTDIQLNYLSGKAAKTNE